MQNCCCLWRWNRLMPKYCRWRERLHYGQRINVEDHPELEVVFEPDAALYKLYHYSLLISCQRYFATMDINCQRVSIGSSIITFCQASSFSFWLSTLRGVDSYFAVLVHWSGTRFSCVSCLSVAQNGWPVWWAELRGSLMRTVRAYLTRGLDSRCSPY